MAYFNPGEKMCNGAFKKRGLLRGSVDLDIQVRRRLREKSIK